MSAGPAAQPVLERIAARTAELGEGMPIRRALPTPQRRLVGAWCFLDHFGPADVGASKGMRVGPHPHIGLQTVTWLIEGEILHRDSLGSVQPIRPGQLNVMTSGRGISHSEESPSPRPPLLHGVQLWIALPESARQRAPAFDHHAELPQLAGRGWSATLLVGSLLGRRSPAVVYTDLLGLDLSIATGASVELPLQADFEHALMVETGAVSVGGAVLQPGALLYLGTGRSALDLRTQTGARVMLIGGAPLAEPVLMWWNFVARTREELAQATRDWNARADYLGEVTGYDGPRLVAPVPPWAAGPDSVAPYP